MSTKPDEDLDSAIRSHERILQLVPGDMDALDALEGLYRENEFFERVIEILDQKITHASGDNRTHLRCEKARVLAEQMLNPEQAVRELENALSEDPASLEAVVALQNVYEAVEDWENVVNAMELEVTMVLDNVHQAATWRKMAGVFRDQLMNEDRAVEAFESALEANPSDVEAAVALFLVREAGALGECCTVVDDD